MFTGIVQGTAQVITVNHRPGLANIQIRFPKDRLSNIERGASVAIDGVCLTVAAIDNQDLFFDVMQETLSRTNLSRIKVGDLVNFERSLKFGDEIGGHLLSGHIDATATILKVETPENNHTITLTTSPEWFKYIFPKGYIGLNGASLTVASCNKAARTEGNQPSFSVSLIPETLRLTTFAGKNAGEILNLEIDRQTQVIVDTVNTYLSQSASK
jgi:riboflavin synthase